MFEFLFYFTIFRFVAQITQIVIKLAHDTTTVYFINFFADYLHDPYSKNASCNTICCRGDLDDKNPRPMGCYDTKVRIGLL